MEKKRTEWYKETGPTMKQWEYLRDEVSTEGDLDEKLRQLGLLGWELVGVCHLDPSFSLKGEEEPFHPWKLFFKRLKDESKFNL